jgi:hypothetical protein
LDFKTGLYFYTGPFFIFVLQTPSMTKDIEPILRALSNYLQQHVLSKDEHDLLESWLRESEGNQDLFNDISNEAKWERDWPAGIPHGLAGSMERIRMRMT